MANSVDIKILTDIRDSIRNVERFQKAATKSFAGAEKAADGFGESLQRITEFAAGQVLADTLVAGLQAFVDVAGDAVSEAVQLENALAGLRSVAANTGQDVNKIEEAAQSLAADGLVPLTDVSASLKNLLAAGLSGDEAIKTFEALRQAASFNRQGTLELGEAIRGATDGIKNQNSILIDNAGITKNLSILQKEYASSIGKSVAQLTDAEKAQAAFQGIQKEAALFQGDYNKLLGTFSGSLSRVTGETTFLLVEIGKLVTENELAVQIVNTFSKGLRGLRKFVSENTKEFKVLVNSGIKIAIVGFKAFSESIVFLTRQIASVVGFFGDLVNVYQAVTDGSDEATNSFEAGEKILNDLSGSVDKFNDSLGSISDAQQESSKDFVDNEEEKKVAVDKTTEALEVQAKKTEKTFEETAKEIAKVVDITLGPFLGAIQKVSDINNEINAIENNIPENLKELEAAQERILQLEIERSQVINDSAMQFTSGVTSALVDTFLPGFGGAAGQIINALSQGPDFVKETFQAITSQIGEIIKNVFASLPDLVDGIITFFIEGIPDIIQSLVDSLPELIQKLIARLPDIVIALAQLMPQIATQFTLALVENAPQIVVAIAKGLVEAIPKAIEAALGSVGSVIGDIGGFIGGIFGLADGGEIVGGVQGKDSVPAMLMPGELVVDRALTGRLDSFISSQQNQSSPQNIDDATMIKLLARIEQKTGSQPVVVNIGGRQLTSAIRDSQDSGRVLSV